MIPLVGILICVIGAVIYIVTDGTKRPELKELGRLTFAAGAIALSLYYGGNQVHVGR